MSQLPQSIILLLVVQSAISATLDPVTIPGNGETGSCPAQVSRDTAIQNLRASVLTIIQSINLTSPNMARGPSQCGAGQWYRVAHLNMSNSAQQCPSAWREYSSSGVRGCTRPQTTSGSCPATFYPTSRQYSRVCGRVIGYQYGTTDAFGYRATGNSIDSYYVYGVSVTHGAPPRNHIWTLAAGLTERGETAQNSGYNCPCADPNNPNNVLPPSFVGNNYYCESGNPRTDWGGNRWYPNDPLWDGEQCEGQCCSDGESPPWFSVDLPNPTTDDIEVRICIPQDNVDDVVIQLLELYVQ